MSISKKEGPGTFHVSLTLFKRLRVAGDEEEERYDKEPMNAPNAHPKTMMFINMLQIRREHLDINEEYPGTRKSCS